MHRVLVACVLGVCAVCADRFEDSGDAANEARFEGLGDATNETTWARVLAVDEFLHKSGPAPRHWKVSTAREVHKGTLLAAGSSKRVWLGSIGDMAVVMKAQLAPQDDDLDATAEASRSFGPESSGVACDVGRSPET